MQRSSSVWVNALLAAGGLLAVALLAQTVMNYRYVSNNLILQEARRVAGERIRNVERAARLARPQDAEAYRVLLEDLRVDVADQVASIVLLQSDGTVVTASGGQTAALALSKRGVTLSARDAPINREWREGREVFVGLFPCRCGLPRQTDAAGGKPAAERLFIEVTLYRDSLSAPFGRLRRNATISASAALALLISLSLIALRLGPYIRGKQLEGQMDLARQVQRDLLPALESQRAVVDVAAECVPAWQVGGDFYDVVSLPHGGVSFVLGDVSGNGLSAALLMSLIHGAMSTPAWGASPEHPHDAAARLNALLLTKSSGDRFASLFWCSYDPATHTLRYLNAGHPPALWLHKAGDGTSTVDRLREGGPVLGLLSGASFRTVEVEAHEGDVIVLFSDGIVDATNSRDEPFGEERLIAVTQHYQQLSARAICDAILSAVRAFAGRKQAQDDQTLLVFRLWPTDRGADA